MLASEIALFKDGLILPFWIKLSFFPYLMILLSGKNAWDWLSPKKSTRYSFFMELDVGETICPGHHDP